MTNSTENQSQSSNEEVVQAQVISVVPITVHSSQNTVAAATEITITNGMRKAYSYAFTIRWVCGIDMFFCFLYALSYVYWLMPLLCSYSGYHGAKHFKNSYLMFYFAYELVSIIMRIVLFCGIVGDIPIYGAVMLFLSTSIGVWCILLTYKIVTLLSNLTNAEKDLLRNMGYTPRTIVYY